MANPRTFTNLISPLFIQSREEIIMKTKLQRFSVFNGSIIVSLLVVGICYKLIMDLTVLLKLKSPSTQQPNLSFENRTPQYIFSGDICGILFNSTQVSSQSLAEVVVLSVCSVVILYAIKYPPLKPVL